MQVIWNSTKYCMLGSKNINTITMTINVEANMKLPI